MDARQLEYFLAIVDCGGFHSAAARLHIAQPSLSQAIRSLERELGIVLFHRVGRRAVISEAGRALIVPARHVVRDLATTRATAEALRDNRAGRVDIAAMPSPTMDPLTTAIAEFSTRFPGVLVGVQPTFTLEETVEAIDHGEAELGVVGASAQPRRSQIRAYHLADHRFVVVAPPNGPLEGRRRIGREDFAGLRVITAPEGSQMRQLIEGIRADGIDLEIAVETAHREAILPLVLQGVGVAVMTEAWAELARGSGSRVLEVDPPEYLRISLLSREAPLTPAARAFLDSSLGEPLEE